MSVVRPVSPGALSNFIEFIALLTSLKVGGFPSSCITSCCLSPSSTVMSICTWLLKSE